ncbi:MAG: phosphomannomutase/phosphoglucomutase [Bacteroidales bacterium]
MKSLQNGSDIRGIAMDGIEGEKINLTSEKMRLIAMAFVMWLRFEDENKNVSADSISIGVGMDSRLSGERLKRIFLDALACTGIRAYNFGLASSPALFMCTLDKKMPMTAGVMITASHLPFNRNGLKFYTSKGGLEKEDIARILEIADNIEEEQAKHFDEFSNIYVGKSFDYNYMDKYEKFLTHYIRYGIEKPSNINKLTLSRTKPLKGLHIIVDAGNGAGGFFATKVLEPLGANIEGSQFLNPDGHFPNHIPNPENKEVMDSICQAVLDNDADLGIIFDTDVDRVAIVDRQGHSINRNSLIALISSIILREHPNSIIVTDSITSDGLSEFITNLGGMHHRFKRGYRNVINESIRLNKDGKESWMAIETSGHCALKENHFLDDGAYLVAKIIIELANYHKDGKDLISVLDTLRQPAETQEIRFKINEDKLKISETFKSYADKILVKLSEKISTINGWELVQPNYEGIRVACKNENEKGWFLLRMSLHDPLMPLNIESEINGGVEVIRKKLLNILNKFPPLKI